MNICLVSKGYPPEIEGGIGTYIRNLAHGLTELGNNVHIITSSKIQSGFRKDKKVFIHKIKPLEVKGLWRLDKYFPIAQCIYSIQVAFKIIELRNRFTIEIVEFPNWNAEGLFFLFIKKGTFVVTRIHTPNFEVIKLDNKKFTLNEKIICYLEKKAVLKSNLVTSSTLSHREMIAKEYNISPKSIKIIPLGVEICNCFEGGGGVDYAISEKKFSILYVSRLERRKGTEVLLKILPDLIKKKSNIHIFIVGKDTNNRYQMMFRRKHGEKYFSNVHFVGFVDRKILEDYYKKCDLFVLPSLYESFGLVYLEAMKYGKAVVGCKSGGIPEVVDNGKTGILVPPNDANLLMEKIIHLIENYEIRQSMGREAKKRVEQLFSVDKMAQNTLKLYQSALMMFSE